MKNSLKHDLTKSYEFCLTYFILTFLLAIWQKYPSISNVYYFKDINIVIIKILPLQRFNLFVLLD